MAKKEMTFKKPYVPRGQEWYWIGEALGGSVGVVVLTVCYFGLGFFLVPAVIRGYVYARQARAGEPLRPRFTVWGITVPMNIFTLILCYLGLWLLLRLFGPIMVAAWPLSGFIFSLALVIALYVVCTRNWPNYSEDKVTVLIDKR